MVDTIRLRLYGIHDKRNDTISKIHEVNGLDTFVSPEHNELYYAIIRHRGKNHSARHYYNEEVFEKSDLTEDEFVMIQNAKQLNEHYQVRQKMAFVEEKEVKRVNWRINGSYRVTSSFSDVTYSINENAGYIDFELSIPKYLYGHNLAEFIPQPGSETRFLYGQKLDSLKGQAKMLYKRLNKIIDKFFSDLCSFFSCDLLPDRRYIEIRRIDLCYNQYFETKEDALMYLNEQRKFNMKRQRKNANIAKSYDTAISYLPSTGSYFKIYHKGSEYSKTEGDLKKHMKINQEFIENEVHKYSQKHQKIYGDHKAEIWYLFDKKGKGETIVIPEETKERMKSTVKQIRNRLPYKVDFLKQEMDKVLRYEVSLTTPFFMNTYKRKLFRKNCPVHKNAYEVYRKTHNALDSRVKNDRRISRNDRRTFKMMKDWLNRSVSLVLSNHTALRQFEKKAGSDFEPTTGKYEISNVGYQHTLLANKDVGHFSEEFLSLCVDHFINLVEHYQIKKIQPYEDIVDRVRRYNEIAEERIKQYNIENHYKTINPRTGEPYRQKDGRYITSATQLLTQSQLREKRLKKVNVNQIAVILLYLKDGKSLVEYFKEMKTPSSTKSRIKKDLEMFGVVEQSLNTIEHIEVRSDYFQYYWNLDGENYRSKFYVDQKHFHYG